MKRLFFILITCLFFPLSGEENIAKQLKDLRKSQDLILEYMELAQEEDVLFVPSEIRGIAFPVRKKELKLALIAWTLFCNIPAEEADKYTDFIIKYSKQYKPKLKEHLTRIECAIDRLEEERMKLEKN